MSISLKHPFGGEETPRLENTTHVIGGETVHLDYSHANEVRVVVETPSSREHGKTVLDTVNEKLHPIVRSIRRGLEDYSLSATFPKDAESVDMKNHIEDRCKELAASCGTWETLETQRTADSEEKRRRWGARTKEENATGARPYFEQARALSQKLGRPLEEGDFAEFVKQVAEAKTRRNGIAAA